MLQAIQSEWIFLPPHIRVGKFQHEIGLMIEISKQGTAVSMQVTDIIKAVAEERDLDSVLQNTQRDMKKKHS